MSATTLEAASSYAQDREHDLDAPVLVVVWSATEPRRVGEVIIPLGDGSPSVFGRGDAGSEAAGSGAISEQRVALVRQRPGVNEPTAALENPFLSRKHLVLAAEADGIAIENFGKRPLLHDGVSAAAQIVVRPGETVEIEKQLVFLCTVRPPVLAGTSRAAEFGEPDEHGFVGESPCMWSLRERCALVGALSAHVLLLGDSGTGKELAAQAIHAQSSRRTHKLVARNAATFPAGLVDAELFGNIAGYPNAGMPERPGVIGEADGSTLFLDEVAEMPHELQSHLLRVLDAGEYARLGDAKRRHADLRVIAATNRSVATLKHDLAARLALRITLPSLDDRREDIPLIARDLLRRRARKDSPIAARFFAAGEPRFAPALVRALVSHTYTTNVRELDSLLLRSLVGSAGGALELTDEVAAEIVPSRPPGRASAPIFTADQIRAALAKHDGVRERVWRELGMANRYVLKRLMKKHNIAGADD